MSDRSQGKAYRARLTAAGLEPLAGGTWAEQEAMLDARAGETDQAYGGRGLAGKDGQVAQPTTARRKRGRNQYGK